MCVEYYFFSIAKYGQYRDSANPDEIRAEHKSGHLREFTESNSYSPAKFPHFAEGTLSPPR
jgi:hypothetical protein